VLLACRRDGWQSQGVAPCDSHSAAVVRCCAGAARVMCVLGTVESLQGLCAVTLGRWACSQWLIISRHRAAHADVSRVAADDRGAGQSLARHACVGGPSGSFSLHRSHGARVQKNRYFIVSELFTMTI
jgi:hypothetical protein